MERGKEVEVRREMRGSEGVERGKEIREGKERSAINSLFILEQLDLKYCYYTHPHIHTQPTPLEPST